MAAETVLAHNVFFSLKENSLAARQKLLDACRRYLTGHPGMISFAVGTRAEELLRPVNDRDFDVSLHLVFTDKAAHDRYQASPRHVQFVEENKDTWRQARVFDSFVTRPG
jgi:hypothetical protein